VKNLKGLTGTKGRFKMELMDMTKESSGDFRGIQGILGDGKEFQGS